MPKSKAPLSQAAFQQRFKKGLTADARAAVRECVEKFKQHYVRFLDTDGVRVAKEDDQVLLDRLATYQKIQLDIEHRLDELVLYSADN